MTTQQMIIAAANKYGVDPSLALAVAQQESGFNQAAKGAAGEVGVFQLMPSTAADLKVNPYDLSSNIDGGVRYLGQQLNAFGGDPAYALMAYNAGPGRVAGGNIPASSIDYANTILSNPLLSASSNIPTDTSGIGPSTFDVSSLTDLSGIDGSTFMLIAAAVAIAMVVGMEG